MRPFAAVLLLAVQLSSDDVAVLRLAATEWKGAVRRTTEAVAGLSSFIESELLRAGMDRAAVVEIVADLRRRNQTQSELRSPELEKYVEVVDGEAEVYAGLPGYDQSKRYALVPYRIADRGPLMLLLLERRKDAWRVAWRGDYSDVTRTRPLRVGGDVKAPVVKRRVNPVYPDIAKKQKIQGIVITEVVIDETGRVTDAVVLKPLPLGLDQAALDAVRQWEFVPGTLQGSPVAVIFNLTINFKLPEDGE